MTDGTQWFVTLADGATERRCWVDKRVQVGNIITLKDSEEPARQWTVMAVGMFGRSKHDLGNQRGWHVGGL